ncbi:uncharacterized protein LOC141655182 [Silene latifolia]|uniref:uncharacterized protein LOC141655182 n=1 Tax=Silene latifolia TaxID=37657 RepID=UPI003D7892BF
MEVTRSALSTLRPRQWVMDQVIDMFGIKTTLHRPDLLYLPSTVIVNCTKKKNPCIWNQYISGTYKPVNGATIRKVFIPLIKDKHWWACICDMESKTNYILNSSNSVQSYDVHNTTIDMVAKLSPILASSSPSYYPMRFLYSHRVITLKVPQQSNNFDCGAHVLRYLSMLDCELGDWQNPDNYQRMPIFKVSVMMQLLSWDANTRTEYK